MKIGIIGYGQMGREIERLALTQEHEVCAIFDIDNPFNKNSELNEVDVLIDFTLKEAVVENLETAALHQVPIVEGTTGWYESIDKIYSIHNLTMLYSPNFSIGVYQFLRIIRYAAKLIGKIGQYDCYLHEWHHNIKADSPSGTAKKLAEILIDELPGKERILDKTSESRIPRDALHVTSTRVGRIPGTHEIGFDSPYDAIFLKHQAHGREGLAYGAIRAAEWLVGKKGIFTMDDFMNSIGS